MNIVLTRPYRDSLKLQKRVEENSSHKCYLQPLLDIEILDKKIEMPDDAVVLITSANGARALAQNTKRRDYKIIAVGQRSAAKASKKGFRDVTSAVTPDVSASESNLVNYILKHIDRSKKLYHISANITIGGLKAKLKDAGYSYKRVILYNANPVDVSADFIKDLKAGKFNAHSFFSPRTAALFSKQLLEKGLASHVENSVAFCFSENVIKGLSGLKFRKIEIPKVTSKENFVKLICETKE